MQSFFSISPPTFVSESFSFQRSRSLGGCEDFIKPSNEAGRLFCAPSLSTKQRQKGDAEKDEMQGGRRR